jgi:hypothetical protein
MRFLILAIALGPALAAEPDPGAIVRSAAANDVRNSELELRYNYCERIRFVELDSHGKPVKARTKTHSVVMIDGTPHKLMLEENGRIATPEQKENHTIEIRRVEEARRLQTPAQRAMRQSEFRKRHEEFRRAIQELPDAFDFQLAGEEMIDSRPAYVINASPRLGYTPVDRYSKLYTKVTATLWIDKAERQWVKVKADLHDTVSFGWILVRIHGGSSALSTRVRTSEGVWVQDRMWYQVSMRIGLFKSSRAEVDTRYSDYVLIDSDARMAQGR